MYWVGTGRLLFLVPAAISFMFPYFSGMVMFPFPRDEDVLVWGISVAMGWLALALAFAVPLRLRLAE